MKSTVRGIAWVSFFAVVALQSGCAIPTASPPVDQTASQSGIPPRGPMPPGPACRCVADSIDDPPGSPLLVWNCHCEDLHCVVERRTGVPPTNAVFPDDQLWCSK